jgi:hypothetical protein
MASHEAKNPERSARIASGFFCFMGAHEVPSIERFFVDLKEIGEISF